MNHILIFLVVSVFTSMTYAQEYRITGRVENTKNEPIVFANVLLMSSKDSKTLQGTSSDENGVFVFEQVEAGDYLLKASFVGNVSEPLAITVVSDAGIGALIIDETGLSLEEVVVTYQKPRLERKVDRLVFNVANTALSDGTIWELLKHTPSVSDIQGILTVKGSANITVMINGRKVNLPQADIFNLLSGASASTVESIEVITNPPSKYSAEGGTIIDIKMSKNLVSGYNGALFNRFRQGVFAKHTLGADQSFKGKKIGFTLNYSFSKDKDLIRYTDRTNFSENGNVTSVWEAGRDNVIKRNRHNVSAFFDYSINDRNTLYMSSVNTINPRVNDLFYSSTLIRDVGGDLLSSFNTINVSDQVQLNTSYDIDWVHKFKNAGAELGVGGHYTYYDSDIAQDIQTDFLAVDGSQTGENDFTTLSTQGINLYSLQADYSIPLQTSLRIEAGLRYAGIASKNTISQEGFDRNQPGIDPTEAGIFQYDEDIYAAYASFDSKWRKWNLKSGVRLEYTESIGRLDTSTMPKEVSYLELFPTLSLKYAQSDKNDFGLQYSRRIERPRYNDINPFQYFRGNNTVVEGNPNLLPTIVNNVTVGYTYDNSYTLEFIYFNMENKYNQQVFQDNESNLLRFISQNLASNYSYGFDFTFDKEIAPFWHSRVILAYYHKKETFNDLGSDQLVEAQIESWFGRTKQSFTLFSDKSLFLDIDFMFRSPTRNGNSRRDGYNNFGILLRKTIWKNRGSISAGVADIFNQGNFMDSRDFLDQSNSTSTRLENRLFSLALRYKFGNEGIKNKNKQKAVEELNRI